MSQAPVLMHLQDIYFRSRVAQQWVPFLIGKSVRTPKSARSDFPVTPPKNIRNSRSQSTSYEKSNEVEEEKDEEEIDDENDLSG